VKGQAPVLATLQGFNFFFSPVLRKYFGESFGMYLSLEYLHTAVSTLPVFNAFSTPDTHYIRKNAFTISVGICFAIEP
jgi:hypothetical protein